MKVLKVGDPVVYRVSKHSENSGRRARNVGAAPRGEYDTCEADRFWTVVGIRDDGRVILRTRRGEEHTVDLNDQRLRHATVWERLFFHNRFPPMPTIDGRD